MAENTVLKRSRARKEDNQTLEKKIMGVPARIMRPRLMFIATVTILVLFGFVMVYSASSVKALSESGSATSYLIRQIAGAFIGVIVSAVIVIVHYKKWCEILPFLWVVMLAALVYIWLFGTETNGASRWIDLGFVRLQPSEFAKIIIALEAANIANRYYGDRSISRLRFFGELAVFVVIPTGLILIQPDKGTTGVIVFMILAVAWTAGFPKPFIVRGIGFIGVVGMIIVLADDYSRQRVLTMLDPWLDPYNTGWQISQGFIAFGSGGLFGVGLGMSRQKYAYLPEAHNDFIFAIIGEELGLVGTLLVLLLFALLVYEAIQIMRQAPDFLGKLIVVGCTALIITQAFLNIMGVLGLFPLSGKPLPFISYGGSSIMSSIMLAAFILNVSLRSTLPETVHDQRRRSLALAQEEDTGVGEVRPRSSVARSSRSETRSRESVPLRPARADSSSHRKSTQAPSLSVIEGGGGYERINLNSDPASRLRSGDSNKPKLNKNSSRTRGSSNRSKRS